MRKSKKLPNIDWCSPDVGSIEFDVNIEKLLSSAKERDIVEYNSWCSVLWTFVEQIEALKKAKRKVKS